MRVLQLPIHPDWIGKSSNPAESAHAACVSAGVLLDDGWSWVSTAELATDVIDPSVSLLLFAKDLETMHRCLRALRDRTLEVKGECYVGVAIWALGQIRYTSPLLAGAVTLLNNVRVMTTSHGRGRQSVKGNMKAAGRDGRLIQSGCAVYLTATPPAPGIRGRNRKFDWYTHPDSIVTDGASISLAQVAKAATRAVQN